ncbi:MAG: ZPR1 zinc finger domain-containing protein [Candidatus Lokiarchaeota archaeon]|nr:ZPR1 zinc finger domain-containing protein [Candidatus Harpocratesius repetitus]
MHPSNERSPPSSNSSSFTEDHTDSLSIQRKASLNRKDGYYEFPPLDESIKCPICGKNIEITRTIYSLPDGDDIIIFVIQCEQCGYRKSDMIPVYTAFQPGIYRLKVDDGDLTHKIFRGATGNLEIPEIGVSIERGPAANFDFTNVEGILLRIEQQIQFFLQTTPSDTPEWKNAHDSLTRLRACKSGEMSFTVILTDFDGGSYITPTDKEKMVFEKLTVKSESNNKNT